MIGRGSLFLWVGGSSWLALIGAGFLLLLNHAFAPAPVASASPTDWPQSTTALPDIGFLPRLVMFVHPHCPCTKASLSELEDIVERAGRQVEVQVVVLDPDQMPPDWSDTETVRQAARIAGAEIIKDTSGAGAARFEATASGHLLLYGSDGSLLYSGGITPSRGHPGESAGSRAILSYLRTGETGVPSGPVFGCPLFAPAEALSKEKPQCCSG